MQPKNFNALPYIFGSLGLIIAAIVISSIINRSQNASTSSTDIRTRASASSLIKVSGNVSEVKLDEGKIVVENLRFEKSSSKSLGTWTVTPPASFNLSSVFAGAKLVISVSPSSMLAASRTLTATEIVLSR